MSSKDISDLYMTRPCKDCPFRKDTMRGWLNNIKTRIHADSFVCHKTNGEGLARKQCAGHMLLRGHKNIFVELSDRLNRPIRVTGRELIFDTEEACIKHHVDGV